MTRFTLHRDAARDLDGIIEDLRALPATPALKIGAGLQLVFKQIAQFPLAGVEYSAFNSEHGFAVRVEILAVIDMRRDVESIMRQRLS